MLTIQTSVLSDRPAMPVHYNDHLIGFLVEDTGHRYRFSALDEHFDLLDGSRFVAPHRALAALDRLSRFIDQPPITKAA
jgi:hypothetical protein